MIYMKNFHEGPSRSHALRGNAARTLRVPAFRLLSQRDRKEHLSKLRQRDFHLAGRGDEAWDGETHRRIIRRTAADWHENSQSTDKAPK